MYCNDKVSFGFKDINTDLIIAVSGTALPTPSTAKDFVNNLPTAELGNYWIERSRFGGAVLCTTLPMYSNMELTCTSAVSGTYTSLPEAFVGPHPKDSHGHII